MLHYILKYYPADYSLDREHMEYLISLNIEWLKVFILAHTPDVALALTRAYIFNHTVARVGHDEVSRAILYILLSPLAQKYHITTLY